MVAMGAALVACSDNPAGPRDFTGNRTRTSPIDAGHERANDDPPPFDWALDGTACSGWQSYWDVHARVDHDGDGVPAEWAQRCTDGRIETIFRPDYAGRNDCDDTDPRRSVAAWRDADGDGFAAVLAWDSCFEQVPAGYTRTPASWSFRDCDDGDPALQEVLYVDADGDLYGAKDEPRCSPFVPYSEPSPPGLTRNANDCDDRDPRRNPGAFEQWNDGFDSDCDGKDEPLDCTGLRAPCGCTLMTTPPYAVDTTCAAADLFVTAQIDCTNCEGYSVVVIGNRGTATARGGFDLVVHGLASWGDQVVPILDDLAPGEKTVPFVLFGEPRQIDIVTTAPECNIANNMATLKPMSVPCE